VRSDYSLRLGDWDTEESEPVLTRPSDFLPTHFRAFREATGDPLWEKVESRCYAILKGLQAEYAPATGLVPDFAERKNGGWRPAFPKALEGAHDGEYSYNACRVPWRIGWAALSGDEDRARAILKPLMAWARDQIKKPEKFHAGYHLDGKPLKGSDFPSACFIAPTGVAAMATGDQAWYDATFVAAIKLQEGYYEDSVNLLSLLVMSGNAWLP
jgi:endo-1,4-beta-D-glucanase Y